MARKTKPLTDTEIKAAKPKDADYQLFDGNGLPLLIKPSGSKLWQFRYYPPLREWAIFANSIGRAKTRSETGHN